MAKRLQEQSELQKQRQNRARLAPGFLIAVNELVSPPFHRNVIFVIENDTDGSMGLVLGNPSGHSVAELNQALRTSQRREEEVFIGGPLDLSCAFILHDDQYEGTDTRKLTDGIALSTSLDSMKVISESKMLTFRCFIGYTGWGPGQLEAEIADGKWVPIPVVTELVFTDEPATLWESVLEYEGIDPMSLAPGSIE